MNKNGVIAVVVVVAAIVLIGLWAMRSGEQQAGVGCSAPPNTPQAVSSSVTGDTVLIRWQPPAADEGITAFVIEATTDRAVPPTVFIAPGTATSYERQAPPATYFVRVAARNNCGTSPLSPEFTVTVPAAQ